MRIYILMIVFISMLQADFVRDDRTFIVKDTDSNLEWQDNITDNKMQYMKAVNYCADLSMKYDDWRLPSKKELISIVDKENFFPAVNSSFKNTKNDMYWTHTEYVGNKESAWLVGFWAGGVHYSKMSYSGYVRCVRGSPSPL